MHDASRVEGIDTTPGTEVQVLWRLLPVGDIIDSSK